MDPRRRIEDPTPSDVASDFVRFCYRRRHARWPELYDEMCAVASRGLYHGWGFSELADHGIGFSLFELPRLAAMVSRIAGEEGQRRQRRPVPVMASSGPGSDTERTAEPTPLLAAAGLR